MQRNLLPRMKISDWWHTTFCCFRKNCKKRGLCSTRRWWRTRLSQNRYRQKFDQCVVYQTWISSSGLETPFFNILGSSNVSHWQTRFQKLGSYVWSTTYDGVYQKANSRIVQFAPNPISPIELQIHCFTIRYFLSSMRFWPEAVFSANNAEFQTMHCDASFRGHQKLLFAVVRICRYRNPSIINARITFWILARYEFKNGGGALLLYRGNDALRAKRAL